VSGMVLRYTKAKMRHEKSSYRANSPSRLHQITGASLIVLNLNHLALPFKLAFSLDAAIMKMLALTYAVERKSYGLISSLRFFKKTVFKNKKFCISNPDHMIAIDCSF